MFRRLPPVARRDQQIRDLRAKISGPTSTAPSYRAMVHAERRLHRLGRPGSSVIRNGKFYVYDVARSHGIEIPEQFGRWADPRDIPWDELPDLVVIKSKRGSNARGVLPLRRSDGGWQIVSHDGDVKTGDELAAHLLAAVADGGVKGPFGAEEFIDDDGTGTRPPLDVKVYAFYGEAPMALLRRLDRHGEASARFRIVDRHGRDAGDHYSGKTIDPDLEAPAGLRDVFDIAERFSIAIRAPFSRIDMYSQGDRIVFGEVTPRPGGPQWFGRELDRHLGDAWERARVRLARDVAAGGSPEVQMGPVATVEGVSASDRAPVDPVHLPSFQVMLNAARRQATLDAELPGRRPRSVISRGKFWVYDLVRSHGIEVPEQYGQWKEPTDIPWDELPDSVVIKSAHATSARGVIPLRRRDGGWQMVGRAGTLTNDELAADLAQRVEDGQVNGPFGAEEFLEGEAGELPIDVRTHAFYGQVPFILLRRPGRHGDLETATFRPVDAHGADLIDVEKYPDLRRDRTKLPRELAVLDVTIPVPKNIEEIVEAAGRLSTAIRLPFARIDMYGIGHRVVFGEVTPRPGGRQWLGPELDLMLGEAWERAEARLRRDHVDWTRPEPEWGPDRHE